jgi:hypothetical protein
MSDSIPESSSEPRGPLFKPVLMARCPHKKVSDEQWLIIRSLIEAGAKAAEVAKQFGIAKGTIHERSSDERWATPTRVAQALSRGDQDVSDPAAAVASLWAKRKEDQRESLYQGTNKALQRFFAMAPVPQTFAEAATAEKLLAKAIDPDAANASQGNVSIQLLATQGFQPKRVIDV